ncbi:MAG: tripartite tricarboxylate transporter substrate binding protein [Betaproteobacteria bacterium]|nr:tripartite tricarboxylate transporter substrate binding protein [Betaproteobacteria bacterium]
MRRYFWITLLDLNPVVCVVKADTPYKTIKDLLTAIQTQPDKLNHATAGTAMTQHLAVEVLLRAPNISSSNTVQIPYKGGGEATAAVLSGQVQFLCNNLPTLVGQIKEGTMRAFVTSTTERLNEFPDVPSARGAGVGPLEQVTGWSGLYGPPGLPVEVMNKWKEVLKKVADDPDWHKANMNMGAIATLRSLSDTEKFARDQFELYEKLGTALGLRK